jgi:hypothetical protein
MKPNDRVIECNRLVALYGEEYRGLIKWAMEFLGDDNPVFKGPPQEAMDRYIWRLIECALEGKCCENASPANWAKS